MKAIARLALLFAAVLAAATVPAGNVHSEPLLTEIVGQPSPDSERQITVAGDWQVDCERAGGKESCRMSTNGSGKSAGGRIVTVQLASASAEVSNGLFFFLTPLDLLVAQGARMRVDQGSEAKLAYRSCHAQGCVIPFRLSSALEKSFGRGSEINLRLYEVDGSTIDVKLSLIGFVAASQTMRQSK
jgi:invasion protein IalB